jgi:hypothetical protein
MQHQSEADAAARIIQNRIHQTTSDQLAALMASLPNPPGGGAIDAWATAALPIVQAGQVNASQMAITYVAGLLHAGRYPRLPAAATVAAPTLATTESPVARAPVLRYWHHLAEGMADAEARQVAGAYAGSLASGDLHAAQRAGIDAGASAYGQHVSGYRKLLAPSSCEWCQLVGAERVYNSPDTVPFHPDCRCGVGVVLASETRRHSLKGYQMLATGGG